MSILFRHTTTDSEGGGCAKKSVFLQLFQQITDLLSAHICQYEHFFSIFFPGTKHKAPLGGCRSTPPRSTPMRCTSIPKGSGPGPPGASGPRPVPAVSAPRSRRRNFIGMRAPCPPRLPCPSGFAAFGGGLRAPGPGCGPLRPGPGLAFGGPGCGALAPGRFAALALAIARGPARRPGCGSPPGAPAAAWACPGPGG